MEYDTLCPMYKQEHRQKHFGVGLLQLQKDELVQFFEGQQPLLFPPEDGATVSQLLAGKFKMFFKFNLLTDSFPFHTFSSCCFENFFVVVFSFQC